MQAIVFVLRGCPAGWLGAYGNEWVATPNLDQLAAESVVFDQHFSDCPEEQAARRAWRTGRFQFPQPTAVTSDDSGDMIAELGRAGVRTVLLRANHPETDVSGFHENWTEVIDAHPQAEDDSPLDELLRQLPQVIERLGRASPWLLWIEIDRLLPPWDVPQHVFEVYLDEDGDDDNDEGRARPSQAEEDDAPVEVATEDQDDEDEDDEDEDEDDEVEEDEVEEASDVEPVTPWSNPPVGPFDRQDLAAWEWLRTSFASVVTMLDLEIGELLKLAQAGGLLDSTAIVVTSDFGWPLGEHSQVGPYRPWLHEEFVHLPLMLRLPGAEGALRRVSALTQSVDLMPTLLELFGVAQSDRIHGRSLLPMAQGNEAAIRPYALTGLRIEDMAEWSLRTKEWAVLLPAEGQEPLREIALYRKPEDRWEMQNVQSLHRDWAEHAREVLKAAIQAANPAGDVEWPLLMRPSEME